MIQIFMFFLLQMSFYENFLKTSFNRPLCTAAPLREIRPRTRSSLQRVPPSRVLNDPKEENRVRKLTASQRKNESIILPAAACVSFILFFFFTWGVRFFSSHNEIELSLKIFMLDHRCAWGGGLPQEVCTGVRLSALQVEFLELLHFLLVNVYKVYKTFYKLILKVRKKHQPTLFYQTVLNPGKENNPAIPPCQPTV